MVNSDTCDPDRRLESRTPRMSGSRVTDSTPYSDATKAGDDTEVQDVAAKEVSQSLSLRSLQTPGVIPAIRSSSVWAKARSVRCGWLANRGRARRSRSSSMLGAGSRLVAAEPRSREAGCAVHRPQHRASAGCGVDHDPPYFVMEYLEKGSLAQLLERGPLPVDEAVRIAKSMAQALVPCPWQRGCCTAT